jgi:hypothetical protein
MTSDDLALDRFLRALTYALLMAQRADAPVTVMDTLIRLKAAMLREREARWQAERKTA